MTEAPRIPVSAFAEQLLAETEAESNGIQKTSSATLLSATNLGCFCAQTLPVMTHDSVDFSFIYATLPWQHLCASAMTLEQQTNNVTLRKSHLSVYIMQQGTLLADPVYHQVNLRLLLRCTCADAQEPVATTSNEEDDDRANALEQAAR